MIVSARKPPLPWEELTCQRLVTRSRTEQFDGGPPGFFASKRISMMRFSMILRTGVILLVACNAGCASKLETTPTEDENVRQAFVALQAALKDRDPDKLWPLLDTDSQASAERAAKVLRTDYEKASPEDKAKLEKSQGLAADELVKLNGKDFLKTKRFHGKYHEIPDSKIDKITVQGETATVSYTEEDGDHEKLAFVRQAGQWKASVPMP
jgi:hypothetical protein